MTKEEGVIDLVRGTDDRLYITSDSSNYVIEGKVANEFGGEIESPVPRLQSGEMCDFSDVETFLYKKLEMVAADGTSRTVDVDYEAAGSKIFVLREGPDRRVYGSGILLLHLFAHNVDLGECIDYGKASESGREAYSMANLDGRIYISSYPAARCG
jgi:hypothetical protein